MLAETPDALQRRDYHALRNLCGSAPVTRRSGKSCFVTRRRACNRRLSNAAFHWAQTATQCDPTSRAKYQALRASATATPAHFDRSSTGCSTSLAPCLKIELCSTLPSRRRKRWLPDSQAYCACEELSHSCLSSPVAIGQVVATAKCMFICLFREESESENFPSRLSMTGENIPPITPYTEWVFLETINTLDGNAPPEC